MPHSILEPAHVSGPDLTSASTPTRHSPLALHLLMGTEWGNMACKLCLFHECLHVNSTPPKPPASLAVFKAQLGVSARQKGRVQIFDSGGHVRSEGEREAAHMFWPIGLHCFKPSQATDWCWYETSENLLYRCRCHKSDIPGMDEIYIRVLACAQHKA